MLQHLAVRWSLWIVGRLVLLYLSMTMVRKSLSPLEIIRENGPHPKSSLKKDLVWGKVVLLPSVDLFLSSIILHMWTLMLFPHALDILKG